MPVVSFQIIERNVEFPTVNISDLSTSSSSSLGAYPFWMLAIIIAIRTLSTAALKNPTVVVLYHIRKFFSHDIRLLPGPLIPFSSPAGLTATIHISDCFS